MNSARVSQKSTASVGTMVMPLGEKPLEELLFNRGRGVGWTGGDHANAHLIFYTVWTMVDSLRCYTQSPRSY